MLFAIGIMLAIVGYDNTLNTSVLTFNNAWLWNGIPMVIIIFCLFAVPQIFAVNYNVQPTIKQTNTFKDVYYTLAKWPTIVRSSVIGYFCGFISIGMNVQLNFFLLAVLIQTWTNLRR